MTALRGRRGAGASGTGSVQRTFTARLLATTASISIAATAPALAADPGAAANRIAQAQTQGFDIPAQSLAPALLRFSRETGIELFFDDAIARGINSPGVRGSFTREDALRRLLSGTGLTYRFTNGNTVTLEKATAAAGEGVLQLAPVTVEGAFEGGRFGDAPPEQPGFKATYQTGSTKSATPIRETPQSVSVITRDSIEARQARDINTALELAAGVTSGLSSGGGPFAGPSPRVADQFSLRGQRLNGDRDVRIDGFAAGAQRNDFDLVAFERVEVVKGPSSMMYGQGSLGGFINLVRKKPQEVASASVVGQAGSFDTYRGEADLTGAFDENKRLLGRLSVAYDDSGSFIDGVESRRVVAAPSLEARVGDATRVLFQLLYQSDTFTPSLGIPLRRDGNEMKIPDISRSFYFGVPPSEKSTTHELMSTVRVDHQITDRWLTTLLLQGTANDRRGIADNYGYGFYAGGNTYVYASVVEHQTEAWAGELRLDGAFDAFGREHKVLVGIEANKRKQESRSGSAYLGTANIYADNFAAVGTIPGGSIPITFDSTARNTNRAAYGQFSLSVLERTKLLAGMRYDDAKQKVSDDIGGTSDEKHSRARTFRFGLTHDLTKQVTAYGTWAQSFNPVGELAADGQVLDPETGTGFEFGLKSEWLDRKLAATIAVFQQDLDNRPIPDPNNGPGQFFSISGGLQRTRGLEVEVSGSPYPGVTIGAAATWLDAEYIDDNDPNVGLTPPETTDRVSAVYASYELQQSFLKGFGLGATWINVGTRYAIQSNQNVTLDGYDRFDLHAFYRGIPGIDVAFQVRNVLDATYIERSNGVSGYGHYFGAPLSFLLRAEAKF